MKNITRFFGGSDENITLAIDNNTFLNELLGTVQTTEGGRVGRKNKTTRKLRRKRQKKSKRR